MPIYMQSTPNNPVVLIDAPGAQRAALWGLADLFALIPRLSPSSRALDLQICAWDALPSKPVAAFVFVPSIEDTRPAPDHPLVDWAAQQHAQGALACSVCAGAFWLGQARLLDHRPATTHWALEAEFRQAFPDVRLALEHILVDDHDVITAGGLMAWTDLGLHLTGRWYGAEMVTRLARHLLIDPSGREQRAYSSFAPPRHHGDMPVLTAQRHMDRHYGMPLTVPTLAAVANLSERSFVRNFTAATGLPPATYLQALRVEKARGALERGQDSIAQIAWDVGYRDVPAFARAFKSVTGLTPGAYRERFRAHQG